MANMGDVIKNLRTQANMTQDELGKMIGVQKSAIAKYESGRVQNLKKSTIKKMADIFNVDPSYILGIEKEQRPSDKDLNISISSVKRAKYELKERGLVDIGYVHWWQDKEHAKLSKKKVTRYIVK